MNASTLLRESRQASPASFTTGGRATTGKALSDIRNALLRWELWLAMAWTDIRQRYRGSMLGPFWVTINMGVMVGLLTLIYGRLLGTPAKDYLPFLALGILVWRWMEHSINESTMVFVSAQRYVRQIRLPITLFIFRLLVRNLIVLAHNFLVYVVVAAVIGLWPGWVGLLAIPGLLLGTFTLFWVCLFFGMLSARFRDFPQIVTSLTQVIFYVTPILYEPSKLGTRRYFLVDLNPVYYFIEIVRAPLLGHLPPIGYWKLTGLISVLLAVIVFPVFRRFRGRVAYWV
jgi:ABC-type polysaccharide/polyol phosphate export permease